MGVQSKEDIVIDLSTQSFLSLIANNEFFGTDGDLDVLIFFSLIKHPVNFSLIARRESEERATVLND